MLAKSLRANSYVEEIEHPIGVAQVVAAILLGFLEATTKPHTTDAPKTPSTAPARSGDRSGGDGLPPVVSPVDFRFASASSRCESSPEFFIRSRARSSYQSAHLSCVAPGSRPVLVMSM